MTTFLEQMDQLHSIGDGAHDVATWMALDHMEHGAERADEVADEYYGYDRDMERDDD